MIKPVYRVNDNSINLIKNYLSFFVSEFYYMQEGFYLSPKKNLPGMEICG